MVCISLALLSLPTSSRLHVDVGPGYGDFVVEKYQCISL